MRTAAIILSAVLATAASAGTPPANPLIGAWEREAVPDQQWEAGDPRQQITFTDRQMIVGIGDGVELRRYEIGRSVVRAETQTGLVYRFRLAGADRICLVPAGADAFLPVLPEPRCYVRRHMPLDRSLV